jgi:hypothetical protein
MENPILHEQLKHLVIIHTFLVQLKHLFSNHPYFWCYVSLNNETEKKVQLVTETHY